MGVLGILSFIFWPHQCGQQINWTKSSLKTRQTAIIVAEERTLSQIGIFFRKSLVIISVQWHCWECQRLSQRFITIKSFLSLIPKSNFIEKYQQKFDILLLLILQLQYCDHQTFFRAFRLAVKPLEFVAPHSRQSAQLGNKSGGRVGDTIKNVMHRYTDFVLFFCYSVKQLLVIAASHCCCSYTLSPREQCCVVSVSNQPVVEQRRRWNWRVNESVQPFQSSSAFFFQSTVYVKLWL